MAHAFPGLCLDRIDGIEDLASYEVGLNPGDHVLMGLVTSEIDDIDALIDRARSFPAMQRMQWVVVTDKSEHRDLARCMQSCALAVGLEVPVDGSSPGGSGLFDDGALPERMRLFAASDP